MFNNIKTLSLIIAAALTLTACADLMYSLGLGGSQKPKNQPQPEATQTVSKPKSYLPQRNEQAINTVRSQYNVYEAAQCLVQHIQSDFNLPESFYKAVGYDDGAATVALVNPNTGKSGLYIDIVPHNAGSQLLLYQNRATISAAWKKLPEKCR